LPVGSSQTRVTDTPRFAGRVAVITGAGTGIGRATATRFAAEGASVLLVGRRRAALDAVMASLRDAGGDARVHVADVASPDDASSIVEAALDAWARIDVLVSNAGIAAEAPFVDLTDEAWESVLETNLTGSFRLSRSVAREMIGSGGGVILFNASIDAHGGERLHAPYNASKAGLVAMMRTMAVELAEHGIRVNSVSPGWTYVDAYEEWCSPELLSYLRRSFERVPQRRLLEAEEVAAAFAFLASEDASAITGHDLVVDGGLTANLFIQESWPLP
jgi:NAD(P)-dependent dehydrogenase (short-subunit alcohol dehydrogenase family)